MRKLSDTERAAAVSASKVIKSRLADFVQEHGSALGASMTCGNDGGFVMELSREAWEQMFIKVVEAGLFRKPGGLSPRKSGNNKKKGHSA